MKIQVTRGEVPIRNVIVRSHQGGRLFTVTIATPLDRHPIVNLGSEFTPVDGRGQRVELYRARRTAGEFAPSTVLLTPGTANEKLAFEGGLFEIDWQRWAVTLVGVDADVLTTGHVVESWEEFERGKADYIEGGG